MVLVPNSRRGVVFLLTQGYLVRRNQVTNDTVKPLPAHAPINRHSQLSARACLCREAKPSGFSFKLKKVEIKRITSTLAHHSFHSVQFVL
jgi:hypothetical protein